MSQRYKIRAFESGDQDRTVAEGTVVVPIERSFAIYSRSAEDAEDELRDELAKGRLAVGRVYQICPPFGNPEAVRTVSVCEKGKCQRVFLDPASGSYSEFKRIRYSDLRKTEQRDEVPMLQRA